MAAVVALNSFLKLSKEPHCLRMASLRGPSRNEPPMPLFSHEAGARFFQKSEWLMWPARGEEQRLGRMYASRWAGRALTTAVEPEGGLEGDALLGGGGLGVGLLGGVERSHVGLVVLLVVKLHDLAGDERLEGIVCVGEVGELVLAGHGDSWAFGAARTGAVVGGG